MALDDHAAQAQQRGAVIAAVIDAVAQTVQHRLGDGASQQRENIAFELFVDDAGQHLRQPFNGLEHDVADKAVADDDVDRALEDVVAFHVAVEIQGAAAQKLGGFLDDFIALDDFFADVEQAHGGVLTMVHRLRQRGAHDGELQKVLGRAVHIRAQVQHRGGAARLVRNGRGDRGAVDAVQRLEHVA
ncbi:hypothetical protein D3C72_719610 [compost metagenome]